MKILRSSRARRNIAIAGSAFVEIAIGLRGRLGPGVAVETLRNILILAGRLREIPLTSKILYEGLKLEEKIGVKNLYDCLHASTALSHDGIIVSNDTFYDRIEGLIRISLKEYARKI